MAPSVASFSDTMPCNELLMVDVLLPNGVIVPLMCYQQSSLDIIKQRVWKEAKRYPLYRALLSSNAYHFVVVSGHGERQELLDENRRLCDLPLFWPTLSLVRSTNVKIDQSARHSRH